MDRRWIVYLGAALCFLAAGPAGAATFTVDSTEDSPADNPADGKCVSKKGGCTLRAAVEEANASTLASIIVIPPGTYKLGIAPKGADFAQSGDLFLTGEVTINGAGRETTIIDGGGLDRVFETEKGSSIWISGLTIQNGLANGADGGALLNRSHLSLNNVVFRSNRASGDPGVATSGRGGALYNDADATLMNVLFEQNTADGRGGGIYNAESASLQINQASLRSNRTNTDSGGGIYNEGTLTVVICELTKNQAMTGGGGIDNVDGTIQVLNSTLSGNIAGSDGGGIRSSGKLRAVNSTITENAAGTNGGGIESRGSGTVDLNNVTIARNKAGQQGKGSGGGISITDSATFKAANTMIALNVAPTGAAPDCAGVLTSDGYDLLGSQAGCTIKGNTEGNIYDKPPALGQLSSSGGPTAPVLALEAGSAGVDAGSPAKPTGEGGSCSPADQRGMIRPQSGSNGAPARCDIGAFEIGPNMAAGPGTNLGQGKRPPNAAPAAPPAAPGGKAP